jgi:serine/threonine protein kinase
MNKFEVLSVIGEGAYGIVLKCRDTTNNQVCVSGAAANASFKCSAPDLALTLPATTTHHTPQIVAIKKFKESDGEGCCGTRHFRLLPLLAAVGQRRNCCCCAGPAQLHAHQHGSVPQLLQSARGQALLLGNAGA